MGIFDKLFGKKSKKVVPEKRPSEPASEAYTNEKLGFSIIPPKGWSIHEPDFGIVVPSLRGSVVFYAPMGKEVKEVGDLDVLLSEGVPHIKIIAMETEMTLDELAEKSVVSIIQLNRKIESKRKRTINDLDAYEYVSTFGSEIDDITFCKSKDLAIVEKSLLYSITFIVKEEDYDRYLQVFEESIQTFQVGEPVAVEPPFIQALKDKDKDVRAEKIKAKVPQEEDYANVAKALFKRFCSSGTVDERIRAAREMADHFVDPWLKKTKDNVGKALLDILVPRREISRHPKVADLTGGREDTPEWIVLMCVVDQNNPYYEEYFWALRKFHDGGKDVKWAVSILKELCTSVDPGRRKKLCEETVQYLSRFWLFCSVQIRLRQTSFTPISLYAKTLEIKVKDE